MIFYTDIGMSVLVISMKHNSCMTNIFKGRTNEHKERGTPRKAFIEETTRQIDGNRYVDMEILTVNRETNG